MIGCGLNERTVSKMCVFMVGSGKEQECRIGDLE